MKIVSKVIGVAGLLLCIALAGCASSGMGSKFTSECIPNRAYLVGGGFSINYTAPQDGTAFWVEQSTQRILETRSLEKGDNVEFGSEGMDADAVKQVLGLDVRDAKFTLYFIPNPVTKE